MKRHSQTVAEITTKVLDGFKDIHGNLEQSLHVLKTGFTRADIEENLGFSLFANDFADSLLKVFTRM